MRSDTSTDIDLSSFQSTFTLPLPKPHTIPAHQFVHSRTPFASPLQLSNVSQLWNDDQCNPSRRLDDELELFGRLSLDDSDDPWRQPQKRTPTCSSANLDDGVDRPWITENPRLSSSPISEVSYQSCPTFKPPRLLAPSRSIRGDSAKNIPKPWAFCPSWSLNATLHDPTVYTETIATFRETPSDDSVFGSDTDSSGPSINARRVSQSTSSKQPQDLLARPKGMYIQHYNPCRNVAYKKSSADFDPHHPSRASMEADIPPKNGVADTSSKILAGASQESMLINQLQSQHAWMNDQPHSTTRSFIPVSYFATHPQFDYPDQWTTTTGLDGPSPRNRKQELYKTEMCRNWEEKGTCEYASRCQFAHGQHELRPVVRDPRWKTKPCKSFVQYGYCPYAKRCCFRHDQGATEYVPSSTNTARSSLLQRVGVMPENSSERRRSTVSLSGSPSY